MIIKAVLLDLDGLLVDSEPLHLEAWKKVAEKEGWDVTEEELKIYIGKSNRTVAEDIKANTNISKNVEQLIEEKEKIYLSLLKRLKLMPAVKEFLQKLRRNHLRLAAVSSTSKTEAYQSLQITGIFSQFDVIVTGSDVKNVKPAPDLYLLAAKKLNVAAGECIALEDSETGLASAKSAGIFCIAVPSQYAQNQNFSKADLKIESIETLLGEKYFNLKTKNPMIGKLLG